MDEEVRFRRAAAREKRGRRDVRRRYSATLQQQAADYWRVRQGAGDGLRDVAALLGVAPWSLRRWVQDARFHPVHVAPSPPLDGARLVIVTPDGVRIEGLDVEMAARGTSAMRWHGRRVAVYAYGPMIQRNGFTETLYDGPAANPEHNISSGSLKTAPRVRPIGSHACSARQLRRPI